DAAKRRKLNAMCLVMSPSPGERNDDIGAKRALKAFVGPLAPPPNPCLLTADQESSSTERRVMTYQVDFENVSTIGLESSPVASALAGLRANEARYFKNKYGHVFTVE